MSARIANVHATCVRLARAGLPFRAPASTGALILGRSGAGKSDLALRLIAAGAELVSDDRTELFVKRGRLCARAPERIAGLIEVRGVGIVNVPYAEEIQVAVVIELKERVARMPLPAVYRPPPGLRLAPERWPSLIRINAREPSAPAKIAAAAAMARDRGPEIVKGQ